MAYKKESNWLLATSPGQHTGIAFMSKASFVKEVVTLWDPETDDFIADADLLKTVFNIKWRRREYFPELVILQEPFLTGSAEQQQICHAVADGVKLFAKEHGIPLEIVPLQAICDAILEGEGAEVCAEALDRCAERTRPSTDSGHGRDHWLPQELRARAAGLLFLAQRHMGPKSA